MSTLWDLIVPAATTNEIDNPSFEINVTDGWTLVGGGVAASSTTYVFIGTGSVRLTSAVGVTNYLQSNAINIVNGGVVSIQARNWRDTAADASIRIRDLTNGVNRVTTDATETGEWEELTGTWTNTTGGAVDVAIFLVCSEQDGASNIWFDACQMEELIYVTTYCDGDQPGCEWNAAEHNSTSQRSAQSRAGGRVLNLATDYGFNVDRMIGVGAAGQSLQHADYEQLPGGITSGTKVHSRSFSLSGTILPTTDLTDLHDQRQALFSVLDPDAVPRTAVGPQPVILRYTDATVTKEIAAHYEAGLEANIGGVSGDQNEKFALRFLADDPFWYEIGQSSQILDPNDTATLRYLGARLRSTGQWSALGLAADPTANGTVYTVLVASDKTVYYGGNFTGFAGNGGWDYMVSYTPSTDTWARIGIANALNGIVYALTEGPDGVIYVGGAFTIAGACVADYLATFTPATNTIAAVAAGGTGAVYTLAFDNNGLLYIGGLFVAWNAVNESQCIVTWNGAAYAASVNGFDSSVWAIAVDSNNTVYATGDFTTDWDGSNPFIRFASFDGTAWTQCGAGLGAAGRTLGILPNGIVTVGGDFTNAGSIGEADYIAQWNRTAFLAMGSGANSSVYRLFVAPNNDIFAGGGFTVIGGITTRLGRWNGSSWTAPDIVLPGAPIVRAADFGEVDPVIPHNFDQWIGFSTTGAAYFAGDATVTNGGTAAAFPQLVISRAGGSSATIISLRNETTGHELSFNNYALQDGETLTVDLAAPQKSMTSSFYGNRPNAILAGSDTGIWYLQPGANNVTCYVDRGGAVTVTAYLLWRDAYKAID